jgi:NitT/TauT family transport system ATP-binding protein
VPSSSQVDGAAASIPAAELVHFDQVDKSFVVRSQGEVRRVEALRGLTFSLREGEFVSVLGPSGCGKTTSLRILAGLIPFDAGRVLVRGKPVRGPGRDRAVVFQNINLLPWKSALENAEFGLKLQGLPAAQRREITQDYFRLIGLEGFEHHYPHELSGGMQQRVGIARALAINPDMLLMDEPFAALDAQTRELMQSELLRILDRTPKTVMFITHSIDEAIFLSDRVVILGTRPGRVTHEFVVDLPKPRYEYPVRSDPQFVKLREESWEALRTSILETSRVGRASA